MGGAGAGIATVPAGALARIGFAAQGVKARSMAALWHSRLGNVRAGSLFSKLQSIGATQWLSPGPMAISESALAAFAFCEVVNVACDGCIPTVQSSGTVQPANESSDTVRSSGTLGLASHARRKKILAVLTCPL